MKAGHAVSLLNAMSALLFFHVISSVRSALTAGAMAVH